MLIAQRAGRQPKNIMSKPSCLRHAPGSKLYPGTPNPANRRII